MRQISELEGAIISGPEDDPDGWKGLPVIAMGGVLFNSRRVEVMCEVGSIRDIRIFCSRR